MYVGTSPVNKHAAQPCWHLSLISTYTWSFHLALKIIVKTSLWLIRLFSFDFFKASTGHSGRIRLTWGLIARILSAIETKKTLFSGIITHASNKPQSKKFARWIIPKFQEEETKRSFPIAKKPTRWAWLNRLTAQPSIITPTSTNCGFASRGDGYHFKNGTLRNNQTRKLSDGD